MPAPLLDTGGTVATGSVLAFTTENVLALSKPRLGLVSMRQRLLVSRSPSLSLLSLRTLRDNLNSWDPETLALLLREELQAYKAVRADTGQERFNIICDLLELTPEETPAGAWARATHLVELAQVLCYHDFAQQTNW